MKKKYQFQVRCGGCKASFTMDFTNQDAHFADYAHAVDWQLSQKCPDCGVKKLLLDKQSL